MAIVEDANPHSKRGGVLACQEMAYVPDRKRCQQKSGREACHNRPLTETCTGDLFAGAPIEVSRREARGVEEVAEYVDCHCAEPQDEAGLVEQKQVLTKTWSDEQQGDTAREQDNSQDHDERTEQSQQRGWWSLLSVRGRTCVVADEPITRAPDFQEDRRNEQYPDEHVRSEQRPDPEYGKPFRRQKDEQHGGDRTRKPGIGFYAVGSLVQNLAVCAGRFATRGSIRARDRHVISIGE